MKAPTQHRTKQTARRHPAARTAAPAGAPQQAHAASRAETDELQRVIAPFYDQLVVTPALIQAVFSWLLEKMRDMQPPPPAPADTKPAGAPQYLPAAALGKRYGMTQKGIAPYLLRWTQAGKIRKIAPINPQTGRRGRPRYSVQEVDTMMQGHALH